MSSHGDFTPWNVGWRNSYVILDFEKYCSKRVVGYDLIHYIVQKLLLVENRADDEIIEFIERNQIVFNVLKNNKWALHIWALCQIDSYLESYENLPELHWQGHKQVNTWIRILMQRIIILAIFAKYSRNIMVVKAKDFTSIYDDSKDIDIISNFSEEEFERILVSNGLGLKKRRYYNRNEYIVYIEKWDVVSIDFLFTLSRKGSIIEYSWEKELDSARIHEGITYAFQKI